MIQEQVKKLEVQLLVRKEKRNQLKSRYAQVEGEEERIQNQITLLEKTSVFSQKIREIVEQRTTKYFEEVITIGLRYIYGNDYSFSINVYSYRNKPSYEFNLATSYGDVEVSGDPRYNRGGGVKEIISLILRFLFIEVLEPRNEMPLIFDEKLRMIFGGNIDSVGKFIKSYVRNKKRQVIFITHDENLVKFANKIFLVSRDQDGKSRIQEVN